MLLLEPLRLLKLGKQVTNSLNEKTKYMIISQILHNYGHLSSTKNTPYDN